MIPTQRNDLLYGGVSVCVKDNQIIKSLVVTYREGVRNGVAPLSGVLQPIYHSIRTIIPMLTFVYYRNVIYKH